MKHMLVLLSVCMAFMFSSCAKAPPISQSDEIMRYGWFMPDEKMKVYFKGDEFIMEGVENSKLSLKGKCFTDENTITVVSESFGTVVFDYELSADKLRLSYFGRTAEFVKDTDFIDIQ